MFNFKVFYSGCLRSQRLVRGPSAQGCQVGGASSSQAERVIPRICTNTTYVIEVRGSSAPPALLCCYGACAIVATCIMFYRKILCEKFHGHHQRQSCSCSGRRSRRQHRRRAAAERIEGILTVLAKKLFRRRITLIDEGARVSCGGGGGYGAIKTLSKLKTRNSTHRRTVDARAATEILRLEACAMA